MVCCVFVILFMFELFVVVVYSIVLEVCSVERVSGLFWWFV